MKDMHNFGYTKKIQLIQGGDAQSLINPCKIDKHKMTCSTIVMALCCIQVCR